MGINKVIYGGNTLIDLTSDTVTTASLLSGATCHDKSGAIINGACTYDSDTSDGTVTADEVLEDQVCYSDGSRIVGTMPNRGEVTGTIATKNGTYSIQRGFHDGSGKVGIDATEKAKIIAGNIKNGVQILGVTGDYAGQTATAEAKTCTPSTSQQIILPTSADYLSQVTVNAIPYTETANAYGTTVTIG